ncbi:unnamed protein product [Hymenolepis diminuta]|uniref:Uncharacterized protein n=1 Tax=Hymenolepis diminuta TaxID=6216 RepID=A0A564Y9J0_HYMDI|nr:unnamed protein product [Hymenolepis diminuta]
MCTRTHHGKCRDVTGHIENKLGVRAETSSTNQQSRSLQPRLVLCLMTKLWIESNKEVISKSSPLSALPVLPTLGIA